LLFLFPRTNLCCLQEKQAAQHLKQLKQQVVPLKERVSHYKGLAKTPEGLTDYSQDFFGKPTFLTVSGQLNAEMYATAMSDVYTFGEACPSCINLSTKYSSCCLQLTLPAVYCLLLILPPV